MKLLKTNTKRGLFNVLTSSRSTQAAMMTLRPGQSSSAKIENEHPKSEQWLFVVSGRGQATISRRRYALREHTLLLVEHGDLHEIKNTSRSEKLVTLNFYVPPAYSADGG